MMIQDERLHSKLLFFYFLSWDLKTLAFRRSLQEALFGFLSVLRLWRCRGTVSLVM